MPNTTKIRDQKTYYDNEIDLILIEAFGSMGSEEFEGDIPFEWLLEYSQINIENSVWVYHHLLTPLYKRIWI